MSDQSAELTGVADAVAAATACPNCRLPGVDGDRFCAVCGAQLVAAGICTGCGRTPPPGANFCPACGTPVTMVAPPPDASAQVGRWDFPAPVQLPVTLGAYAGFWRRLVASLIDLICVIAVGFVTILVVVGIAATLEGGLKKGNNAGLGLAVLVAVPVAIAVLYVFTEASERQATPGKRAVGLQVVRQDGGRIDRGLATGRFFARLLSLVTLGGGYLWMLTKPERLAMHDAMTETEVRRRVRPGPGAPPPPA